MFSRDELFELHAHISMCLSYHKACLETVLETLINPSNSGVRDELVSHYNLDIQKAELLLSRIKDELDKSFGA